MAQQKKTLISNNSCNVLSFSMLRSIIEFQPHLCMMKVVNEMCLRIWIRLSITSWECDHCLVAESDRVCITYSGDIRIVR